MYVWVFSLSKIRFYKTRLTCSSQIEKHNKKNKKELSQNGRDIEPWSLTKSETTTFSPFQTISGRKYFLAKNFVAPPPPPTLPTKGGDHGAKKPTMVPTMVPWCQPIFSPYQIISGRKYFLVKKFPPSPPPVPLWHKDRGDGGERGGMVIVSEKWSEQVSSHFR